MSICNSLGGSEDTLSEPVESIVLLCCSSVALALGMRDREERQKHTQQISETEAKQFSESGGLNSLSFGLAVGWVVTGCVRVCPGYHVSESGALNSLSP